MELDVERTVRSVRVAISARAAFLHIMRDYREGRRGASSPAEQHSFCLHWEIHHRTDEITIGTRVVSEDDLRGMFGLALPRDAYLANHPHIQWALACVRTTGAAFEQVIGRPGQFLRADEFLVVPGPGIGRDGDPNISIEIDVPMRDAVRNFIENS